MKTRNKLKLTNLTTWIMIITISIISIWFVGFVVANTFDLNVFAKKTSDFIFGFLGFSAVLVICSAILNISLNIGIIADSKVHEQAEDGSQVISKKFYLLSLAGVIVLISILFLGDYLTRRNEKMKLIEASEYIVETYSESIAKIGPSLSDTSKVAQIPEILEFLSNQKSEFPSITLITSAQYDGQLTFLEISWNKWQPSLKEPLFGNSFYECDEHDCVYLQNLFNGKTNEKLFWTEENDYKLYYPFVDKGNNFVLLFNKYERYGKVGSR